MLTDPQEDYERGFVPFLDTTVYLDSKPLIPRTETEYWVEKAIEEITENKEMSVLDLFAGSGCIGVSILHHRPLSHVTFGEYEERHLKTIEKNVIENNIDPKRTEIIQTNVWSNVLDKFDFIFANPPYVSKERNTASEEALLSEPHEALFAEDDGFFYIEKVIESLPSFLNNNGVCFIEHEPFHADGIQKLAKQTGLTSEANTDQYGVLRYSRLTMA